MFNRTLFQRVIAESGLSRIEIAAVLGVSRATLYLWLGGGDPHPRFLAPHVNRSCEALCAAIDKKILPLPRRMARDDRRAKITKMAARLNSVG